MLWISPTEAHEIITTKITWGREISRVFARRCTSCHHTGGPAFDLGAYERARPWAEAIKQEVLERRMPPWGAVKGFGDFRGEEGLTEMEIALISSWVEGGAPRGDLNLLPKQIKTNVNLSAPPKTGNLLLASDTLTLKHSVKIAAVRPQEIPEGASLRLIAERPNGAVEPLIWLYSYASRFQRTYYFKEPVSLGAGTKIRIHPAVGSVSLLLAR
ncbi:MAG TPA: cytochrome c [Terriglobia bacterium]|nr:cytochrome c [Terriglobia bacterium]